jgi:hypothetical protein
MGPSDLAAEHRGAPGAAAHDFKGTGALAFFLSTVTLDTTSAPAEFRRPAATHRNFHYLQFSIL